MINSNAVINKLLVSRELQGIKSFITINLTAFKTKKMENHNFILKLIQDMTDSKINDKEKIIELLSNRQDHIPTISTRLLTLIFTLRKQVENIDQHQEMGICRIFPDANAKLPEKSINKKFEIETILNNISQLKKLSIVIVYGNVNTQGNIYGHALLRLGDIGYLHINNLYSRPYPIPNHEFAEQLRKENSFVVDVQPLFKDKDKISEDDLKHIARIIVNYSTTRWFWQITHHNCLSFAQTIAHECTQQVVHDNGLSDHELGRGNGESKTPIPFFMQRDKERRLGSSSNFYSPGFLERFFYLAPKHNTQALMGAARQGLKNIFLADEYKRVDIILNDFSSSLTNDNENTNSKLEGGRKQDQLSEKQTQEIDDCAMPLIERKCTLG